jgi:hypothetical protein
MKCQTSNDVSARALHVYMCLPLKTMPTRASDQSANNRMQRSGHDKVQGRRRSLTVLVQVLRARVQIGQRAVADAGR